MAWKNFFAPLPEPVVHEPLAPMANPELLIGAKKKKKNDMRSLRINRNPLMEGGMNSTFLSPTLVGSMELPTIV